MVTSKQIEANRLNAQKSTGPKSESGRKRSSQNALRHGLAAPLLRDGETVTLELSLAHALGVQPQNAGLEDFVTGLLEVGRTRRERTRALEAVLHAINQGRITSTSLLLGMGRYERLGHQKRRRGLRALERDRSRSST